MAGHRYIPRRSESRSWCDSSARETTARGLLAAPQLPRTPRRSSQPVDKDRAYIGSQKLIYL
jgi:hypothetical protein